ncbi:methyltransferase domain-containing protein [Crossiella sp. SN42]|uniref:SAM-dependent methyltransferase n=1 Tax=Crossiella sp. SN42 TaxID=2944808 RepID=UPI00207D371A|nr:methyltransferase domain-containing protein [Crossiella sp. SN42]MCO1581664.1 methyltransferase domain-containing protein [Crossiella sp. SN42]
MTVRPAPAEVSAMYDQLNDLFAQALGGSIHLGYWRDDQDHSPISTASERLTTMVADRLLADPDSRLLDIGCGNGLPALQIATTRQAHVTGITLSDHQVTVATKAAAGRELADRVTFQRADAMDLSFADNTFDHAWAIESLAHMPDHQAALKQAARVVKPGGRLVIADVAMREPLGEQDWAIVNQVAELFHARTFPTHNEFRANLAATGWEVLDYTDIGDQVRAGYGHFTALLREVATTAAGQVAAQLSTGADALDAMAALPCLGYVLITARRS